MAAYKTVKLWMQTQLLLYLEHSTQIDAWGMSIHDSRALLLYYDTLTSHTHERVNEYLLAYI